MTPHAKALTEAPAISVTNLTKRYGTITAVDGLDLSIEQGEVFGLLGPNGAGKTTTILTLLGLTTATSGTVLVQGLDPARHSLEVKRRVGYMPDDVGFYDDLTGRQNLRYTARLNRIAKRDAESRIAELLVDIGLEHAADRKVGGYSRGMRQRLGLADALVKSPSILVLDEPTVNIDPEGVRAILDLVRRISDTRGTTVLLSSHLLHQVEQVCDRIGIFLGGRMVACGSLERLAARVQRRWLIEVGFCDGQDGDRAWLAEIDGVDTVESEAPYWLVTADHDLRADITRRAADHDRTIVHLRRRGADLDAIYHQYFSGGTDAAA